MSDDNPDREYAAWSAWQDFNRIYKCLSSREVQTNRSVARGRDIRKYFDGANVVPAGVVHYIHVGGGTAINRETYVAACLLKPRRFCEQQMNLVSSRRDGKITMKDAAPPAGKKLRILSALNSVARNGEGASS